MNEEKITKSISSVKPKRKRRFNHHTKSALFEKYANHNLLADSITALADFLIVYLKLFGSYFVSFLTNLYI